MKPEELLALPFVVAFGAILGSFANVCIHRLPRGESVVSPRSRCPKCLAPIRARDNVPVLSWLLLRGRCRGCGASISVRYPLVEAAVAFVFLAALVRHGLAPDAIASALLGTAALVLAATDLDARVLPDEVTLVVLGFGLLLAAWRDLDAFASVGWTAFEGHLLPSAAGAAFGALLLYAVAAGYRALRGTEGMGLGDVKMIAMIGAFVGPAGVLLTLFAASLAGTVLAGVPAAIRSIAWRLLFRSARRSPGAAREAAAARGLLVDRSGRVVVAGPRWAELPDAPGPGRSVSESGPVARPAAAFARLALRRGRAGKATAFGRLAVEDDSGDFFRVLAARGEMVPDGLLVLLARVDVPFGVFLAIAAVVVRELGGGVLDQLAAGFPLPGRGLLP